ncbi:MAG: hypothetical protein CMB59_03510 [Euryarchaeota archaeon]|nr:hypothetical protein [Euryarchaeota archaeon]
MPLIDESESILDAELILALRDNFTYRDGLIIDKRGHCWYRWRSDGLDAWWRIFEEIIDAPMGRKLANSACDEEEGLLNSGSLDFTGLFRRKKATQALEYRWWLHGWGKPNIKPPNFTSTGLTPLFAGIFQADFERINSKRYRMRWEEKSSENCVLTLDESDLTVVASKPRGKTFSDGDSYDIKVESNWKIDGLKHHLLPVGIFTRLQDSCAGLTANISEDERNSWPAISDGFLAFALAAKRLFIAGEEIFLAADANGWLDSCKSFFGPMGMSYPISSTELDSNGGIELKFTEIPLLSLTAGFLAGAWVRCEGRPVKVAIREEDNFTFISLQTRYELN